MGNKAFIPFRLPGLNEYIDACRGNKYGGAKMKKDIENRIFPYFIGLDVFTGPIKIGYTWHEKTKRRDIDNVAFAKKFIQDSLVTLGKIKGDSPRYVNGIAFDLFVWGDCDGVEIEIFKG